MTVAAPAEGLRAARRSGRVLGGGSLVGLSVLIENTPRAVALCPARPEAVAVTESVGLGFPRGWPTTVLDRWLSEKPAIPHARRH